MGKQPLISVCINAYNAEHCIEATVQSVLDQTYPHLQIIVVDDCSTDNTYSRLQAFTDDRIELYRLPRNGHISNANNEALSHVRGEFVAHLDADDIWYPDKLEKQLRFLLEHPEYGACFALSDMVDENGNEVEDHRFRAENLDQATMFYRFLTAGNYLNHSSMLARRDVIDRIGKHDVTLLYFHDFDYWIRMLTVCKLYILPENLLSYRLSTASNSAMTESKQLVHVYEFARIAYQSIVNCPDALFLEAFADRLRLKDTVHTPAQIELEKAFVLSDLIVYLPQNRALGLRRLCELLADDTYAAVARDDFGFTIHDLYKAEETTVFHDEAARAALAAHADSLQAKADNLTEYAQSLRDHADNLEAINEANGVHMSNMSAEIERLKEYLGEVTSERDAMVTHADNLAKTIEADKVHMSNMSAEIERIKDYLETLTKQHTALNEHADNLAKTIEANNVHMGNMSAEIERYKETLQAVTTDRDNLQIHIQNVEADRARILEHVEQLTVDRNNLQTHIQNVEADRARILEHVEMLTQANAQANEQIAMMTNSLSWKITKPLRFIQRLFRRS